MSACHVANYQPSKHQISNLHAAEALLKALQSTYIYRYAEDFCQVRVCVRVCVWTCVFLFFNSAEIPIGLSLSIMHC